MSQQLQQPQTQSVQPQYQAQTPVGQAIQGTQVGQLIGQRYRERVPQEIQQAVADLDHFESICEFTHQRAMERGMVRVGKRCDELAQIAHLEKHLILAESPFAQPIGQAVRATIQQGLQDLQQQAGQPEVQDAISQGQQVLTTINDALTRLQTWGQQGAQSSVGAQ